MGNPGNPAGLQTPAFNASFAFFLVFMGLSSPFPFPHLLPLITTPKSTILTEATHGTGLVCLVFLICSLRTNIVFFVIFLSLVFAFACLSAAYWNLALVYENPTNLQAKMRASKLTVVSLSPLHLHLHLHPYESCFANKRMQNRQAAPSLSSRPWPDGGFSSRLCWRVWTFR